MSNDEQLAELRRKHDAILSQILDIEKQIIDGSNNDHILALLGALGGLHTEATLIYEQIRLLVMAQPIRSKALAWITNRK